jgi:2-amino-4-hydroxy-6-hydroxymethyldihydropteridine diphosphokinase
MTVAYIGIGSNVGERRQFVRDAVAALDALDEVEVLDVSSLYETSPIGGPPQRSFINLAVKLETGLEPRGLLEACKAIESRFGREPSDIRWGPRVVDLDILLYGEEKVNEPDLEIPHPRLRERKFALIPLLEMEPGIAVPWEVRYSEALDEAEGDVEFIEGF